MDLARYYAEYLKPEGFQSAGVYSFRADEPQPIETPRACPITGKYPCKERTCELHYMDAPVAFNCMICCDAPELPRHQTTEHAQFAQVELIATADTSPWDEAWKWVDPNYRTGRDYLD